MILLLLFSTGRPEPIVTWYSGMTPLQTGGGVSMGRHVTVNRLEISHVKRDALNTTYVCQASNTKLVPPAERTVRVEMLCECQRESHKFFTSAAGIFQHKSKRSYGYRDCTQTQYNSHSSTFILFHLLPSFFVSIHFNTEWNIV